MAPERTYVARYRAAWTRVTRGVLGTGVGVLAACFVALLPELSAGLLLCCWVGRRQLRQQLDEWVPVASRNEGLVLLSVGLPACLGWTLLLGPAGAGLVVLTLAGAVPLLVDRQREIDLADAWRASERALTTAADPAARLWLVRQRADYLDDLERSDPQRLAQLTRDLGER